jgi:hypothetical protein
MDAPYRIRSAVPADAASLGEIERLRDEYISTEHLLLAMLQGDSPVSRLLTDAGLVITTRLLQEPDARARRPSACLLARKPG